MSEADQLAIGAAVIILVIAALGWLIEKLMESDWWGW